MERSSKPILRRSLRLIEQPGYLWRQGHHQRNPFDLGELLLELGQYLDVHTLTVCIRVSRHWYRALAPKIWADISLNFKFPCKIPSSLAFWNNAVFIRKLKIICNRNQPEYWNLDRLWRDGNTLSILLCPNLSHLTVKQGHLGSTRSLGTIVRRHRKTLKSVTFSGKATLQLIEALADCPRLKHMECVGVDTVPLFLTAYERLWSRLEAVTFQGLVNWMPTVPTPEALDQVAARTGPSRIRELSVNDDTNFNLYSWMIQQSPELTHLQCSSSIPGVFSPIRRIATAIGRTVGGRSPLESFILHHQTFSQESFWFFLGAATLIKKLDMSSTNFSRVSWVILRLFPRHLNTITELSLDGCSRLGGTQAVEMLCMMPNLEVLRVDGYIQDPHVLGDYNRPWICRGLKVLVVDVELISTKAQRMFLKRVSELVRLETFCICAALNESRTIGYRLELEGGLDRLRTLGQLRSIVVYNTDGPNWREEEVRWMKRFWPKVDTVRGFSLDEGSAALLHRGHVTYESDDNWSDDGSDDNSGDETDEGGNNGDGGEDDSDV